MLDLKHILKSHRDPSHTDSAPGIISDHYQIQPVKTASRLLLGRQLAFVLDDRSLEMAAVSHYGTHLNLVDIQKIYLPSNESDHGDIDLFLSDHISAFYNKHRQVGTTVNLTLSGRETAYRTFLMPVMKPKDLDSAIRYEVRQQLPFPADDASWGYRITFKVGSGDQARYRIALTAATTAFVEQYLRPFRELEIPVHNIYLGPDVIGLLLKSLPNFDPESHYTMAHVKGEQTEIAFYRGASLEFFNAVSVGSKMIGDRGGKAAFQYFAESLAGEIQTSLDYYTGQYSRNYNNTIYLYGDIVFNPDSLAYLNDLSSFNFSAFPIDQIAAAEQNKEKFATELSVCLPALAASTCAVKLPNLLPIEHKREHKEHRWELLAKAACIVVTAVMLLYWYTTYSDVGVLEQHVLAAEAQVTEFKNSEAYHTYNNLKQQIKADQDYLQKIEQHPSHLGLLLKELSRITPNSIRLYHIDYNSEATEDNSNLHGLAVAGDIPPEVILAEYAETLQSSPFFDQVRIVRHVKRREDNKFEIDFSIAMGSHFE